VEHVKPRSMLADCPYCGGTGSDAAAWDRRCGRCNGRGRMARFVVEEILARWAAGGWSGDGLGLAAGPKDKGTEEDAESAENTDGGNGGGRDDDPEPPRPYRYRRAA
jgi:hypothetical protein